MQYTISKEADKKIQKDMEFIVKAVREKIPGTISIILTGGFSRGEGPVKKIKDKFHPYNDYDIQVISKTKLEKEEVDRIATEISKKIGHGGIKEIFYPFRKENQDMKDNFYLDLKCDSPEDLKKLLPRIRNYEFKYESHVLWGRDLRHIIPDFKLTEVPLSDSAKLLLDRLSQLIEYYSIEGKHDKEFLSYVIQQAYAACCTALLSLVGKYQVGYTRSMNIFEENYEKDFPELYKKIPDLHKKIEQFVNWKKDPKKLPNNDVEEEWFIAKDDILEVSKYFFSRFLNKKIGSGEELAESILNMGSKFYTPYIKLITKNRFRGLTRFLIPGVSFVLKRKYNQRLKSMGINRRVGLFGPSPDLIIFSSLIYISSSIEKESKIDLIKLDKGKKLLSRVYPVNSNGWEEVSLDYANSYIAFFMQKL
jgi:hypothetical protein